MKAPTPRLEVLENGVWVATESLPHVRSASLGIYLDTGSRDESPVQNGLSHFFEHMVFKGTHKMGPLEIVKRFEATGGQVNAYTSKEQTCFYGKVVDTEAEGALEVLLDMVFDARFDPADVTKEKSVVLEEIRSTEDNADDLVYDLFSRAAFGNHALGHPIAGTEKTVRGLTREQLVGHRQAARDRLPVIIVAVGRVDHDTLLDQIRRRFKLAKRRTASQRSHAPRTVLTRERGNFVGGHVSKEKDVQQASVVLGGPGYAWNSKQRFALLLLHSILGDGMSSKLFQNLREKHGLVYNISSNPEFLSQEGLFTIGFATEPKNVAKATREIVRELGILRRKGLTAHELDFAKQSITGSILLGLESTSARMATLARRLIAGEPGETVDRILRRIEAVTPADIRHCAAEIFRPQAWASGAVFPKGFSSDLSALLAKG